MRIVRGVLWAKRSENPWGKSRARGKKAKGLAFERKLASAIPGAEHNPWFQYEDTVGIWHCSPDLLMLDEGLVIECKLQNWEEAWAQLYGLYLPVLNKAFKKEFTPVVVVKYVTPGVEVTRSLAEAVVQARRRPVMHWLGVGPFPMS